ncbi:MAG TPA: FAD:protein FMN transferase [Ktedonobacterales bacterium]
MSIPAAEPHILVQRAGRPMATDVSVQIAAAPEQVAAASSAADACMAWFDEVDGRLSRFRPESELSCLNRAAGQWVAVSNVLFDAVAIAMWAAEASNGRFDPTLLPQIEALGYDRDFALIAHREAPGTGVLPAAPDPDAWSGIVFDPTRKRLRLPEGLRLDLGGIAKGWAADVALSRYCAPFAGALVNLGGDLRARGGPTPNAAWSIGIRDPREESTAHDGALAAHVGVVTLSRGGLATSGALRRWWLRDGQRQHHVLDPRTGRPVPLWIDERDAPAGDTEQARPIATATALARTAARAEVAAKVALLRGYPRALRTVEAAWKRYGTVGPEMSADVGVALVLTFGTGEVLSSSNLTEYLATAGTEGAALQKAGQKAPRL